MLLCPWQWHQTILILIIEDLLDGRSNENILIYGISYKTLIGAELLRITHEEIDDFIWVYDRTRLSGSPIACLILLLMESFFELQIILNIIQYYLELKK